EREVLRVVVTGDTNKVIARKLKVTERTVEKHRGAAMRKLGVRSVAELIRAAIAAEEVSQRAERRLPKAPDEAPA
ncbi:MAG: LuxR C-terminal-related transcriptional regulator, partial [Planctomycetota bacterium]